jgi:outer membrane protein OmpA-like peptidoglycan-associated protein
VLDNTYNLNIAPLKNPGSTNIVDGKVKKYMFSIENLAWRTSNRAGLTYEDLPECEKGPNGGRVMWFPPYDLTLNESSKPSFTPVNFLGRPEPIYTYKDTSRSGSLTWKIVVDHPSILNLIVNKELTNQQTGTVNQIVDSFIAGCLKYDIYELAKRWNTLRRDQLVELQKKVVMAKSDEYEQIIKTNQLVTEQQVNKKDIIEYQAPDFSSLVSTAFYFDNDIPKSGSENFYDLYNSYSKNSIYQQNSDSKNFMDFPIKSNFETINNELISKIKQYFETYPKDNKQKPNITIQLVSTASAPGTKDANLALSERRSQSVKTYLDNYFPDQKDFINVKLENGGEQKLVDVKNQNGTIAIVDCQNNEPSYLGDPILSIKAMSCRRVSIKSVIAQKPEQVVNQSVSNSTKQIRMGTEKELRALPSKPATVSVEEKFKEGIGKAILRSLLTECDYFELLKESDPMFYDSMKQKIKYFSPAFHAITPEGLNSRLTFLQQCTRPGDTIPVIDINGKPKYNNAVNTAFGAPPVLILRVGDFFNTKIIPNDIQFAYEPLLDINPEGIGVQPMIVKVTLQFNIVGGMGLKEPVQKLQNALSFNYYANTEVYDERSEWTDDSFKQIDENLKNALFSNPEPVTQNDNQNNIQNPGGETIGTITNKSTIGEGSATGATGDTSYKKVMDSLYDNGQSYLDTATNKMDEIFNRYNLQVLNIYLEKLNYSEGETQEFSNPVKTRIIGKPFDYELRLKDVKDDVVKYINNETFDLIRDLKLNPYKNKDIKKVSDKLIDAVEREYQNIITELNLITQKMVEIEQKLVNNFAKLDFVVTERDGYIKSDQQVLTYKIKPSGDTLTNLKNDYKKASDKLVDYFNILKDKKIVEHKVVYFRPGSDFEGSGQIEPSVDNSNDSSAKFWIIMSRIITDNSEYNRLLNEITPNGEIIDNGIKLKDAIKTSLDNYRDNAVSFKSKQTTQFNSIKTTLEPFKKWDVFVKGLDRLFSFNENEKGNDQDEKRLKNIYKQGNSNSDKKTFNGKNIFL